MKPTRSVGTLYISGFVLIYQCWTSVSGDPCLNAVNIGDYRRSILFSPTAQDPLLCDRNIDETLWYRFDAFTGGKMPESCVSVLHCGTLLPIWMNGVHPTAAKPGPKTAEVCAPNWGGQKDCCKWKQNISVRWCQDATTGKEYFVYQLKRPPYCSMSYCAGSNLPCNRDCSWNGVRQSCSCPAYPTMTGSPNLSAPRIVTGTTKVIDAFDQRKTFFPTKFVVDCEVRYPRQAVDDGARFDVVFEVNGNHLTRFPVSSVNPVATLDESFLVGHLGKELTCKVSSYWDSSEVGSRELISNRRWFGLQPVDRTNTVISGNVVVKEGEKVSLWMKSTFPITTSQCFDELHLGPCRYSSQLYVQTPNTSTSVQVSNCAMVFNKDTDRSVELEIAPIPVIDSMPKPIIWQLEFEAASPDTGTNRIFTNYKIQSVNLEVRDRDVPPQCQSVGDPHITTFPNADGVRNIYNAYDDGVYYLVRLQTRNLEIQVQHVLCGRGTSCTCGVLAREGNSIIGITKCSRSTPLLLEYRIDNESPTGTIHTISNGWKISLLSGIEITVTNWATDYMDLYVTAIRSELTQYDGLCSAFSVPRGSICTSDCNRYRVPATQNFFIINDNNLPKCSERRMPVPKCICNGKHRLAGDPIAISCGVPIGDPRVTILLSGICSKHKRQINSSSDNEGFTADGSFTLDEFNNNAASESTTTADTVTAPYSFSQGNNSRQLRGFDKRFFKRTYNQKQLVETPLSFEDGRERCRSALHRSFARDLCSSRVKTATIVDTCALDVQMMNDYGPSNSVSTQFEMACLDNIRLALETYTSKDLHQFQELKTLLFRVESLVCPSQCSQKGQCINSICHCDDGYMGIDCSLKKGQVPVLQRIFSSICDVNKHPCKQIHLVATDFTNPSDVVCRMRSVIGSIGDVPSIQYSTPVVSGGLVICNLPSMPISKDEVNNRVNTNTYLVQVSISNNGQTYSQELPFTVFDGRCMECPASHISPCQLKENTCSIRGRCYLAGDRCQENDARICNPSKCGTKWSSADSVDCLDGFEDCN